MIDGLHRIARQGRQCKTRSFGLENKGANINLFVEWNRACGLRDERSRKAKVRRGENAMMEEIRGQERKRKMGLLAMGSAGEDDEKCVEDPTLLPARATGMGKAPPCQFL